MKSDLEISQILNVLMRFSMTHEGLDASSAELQKLFKRLQPTARYEHRTTVVINAGIKFLDQRDWLQIRRGELKSEIFHLLHDAANEKDEQRQNELLIEALAKVKVLGHSQLLSTELNERASEYLLQADTHILSNLTKTKTQLQAMAGAAAKLDEEATTGAIPSDEIPSDEILAGQLKALSDVVASRGKDLSVIHANATGYARYISQSDQSFEAQVQSQALAGIVAYSQKAAERASSLCDVASNSFYHFGNRQPADALTSKQWLIAYALTAATIIGACRAMVADAFVACGNSTELKECDFAHFLQHAFKRSH
ncbi:MAG: hypothetical protein Q8T09_22570 [Candidatus Melainabacteria bacterium]|nr:hypothetical protein [Candidatus Melainabacteria bacterium]